MLVRQFFPMYRYSEMFALTACTRAATTARAAGSTTIPGGARIVRGEVPRGHARVREGGRTGRPRPPRALFRETKAAERRKGGASTRYVRSQSNVSPHKQQGACKGSRAFDVSVGPKNKRIRPQACVTVNDTLNSTPCCVPFASTHNHRTASTPRCRRKARTCPHRHCR